MFKELSSYQKAVLEARAGLEAAIALREKVCKAVLERTCYIDDNGYRITEPDADWNISDDSRFRDYLKECCEEYKKHGVELSSYDTSYLYPFEKAVRDAEDALLAYMKPFIKRDAGLSDEEIDRVNTHWKSRLQAVECALKI